MTFVAVHNAIRTKFQVAVVDAGAITADLIAWDNALFDSEADGVGSIWARFSILQNSSEVRDLGGTTAKSHGMVVVSIFVLAGIGDTLGLTLADAIVAAFKATTYTSGGAKVVFRTPKVEPIGRRDAWWQINVTIPFFTESA